MVAEQAQIFEDDAIRPSGFPSAVVAGNALNLKIFIAGEAVAQSRPRGRVVAAKGRAPFVQFYEEKKSAEWQEQVAVRCREQVAEIPVDGTDEFTLPASGRVLMTVRFNMVRPKSYPKTVIHHVRKPDIDNLVKALLDGLVKGRIIEDDNLVTDLMIQKRYIEPGHPAGVEVDLTVLPV